MFGGIRRTSPRSPSRWACCGKVGYAHPGGNCNRGESRAMSVVGTATGPSRSFFSIDISRQNIVFSFRTAAAAILALAIAYWLELSDPAWATLTVYILAQPTVGAA